MKTRAAELAAKGCSSITKVRALARGEFDALNEVYPERDMVLTRELTKKFEEFLRGKPAALLELPSGRSLKGEFAVLVGAAESVQKKRFPSLENNCRHLSAAGWRTG